MSRKISIKYDEYIKAGANAWAVKIDKQQVWFPYSLCELDETSNIILCPPWLVFKKELEEYVED